MTDYPLKKTKIVCTIGPACWDQKVLQEMADAGMTVARLNFSHGDHKSHKEVVERIRSVNDKLTIPVALMLDTKGAEIRTGDVSTPITIKKDQEVVFSSQYLPKETRTVIGVSYDHFAKDVVETDRILLDNGELSFDIVSVETDGTVVGRACEDGEIGSRRHINLPGADIDLPSITDKDWEDIALAAELQLDYIALSFIREADEVTAVRQFLEKKGFVPKLISKIETQKAVKNIQEIIEVSDGIMVARGDLGADVPFEQVPLIQDEIVVRCKDAGKPVIIATHMLESMKEHPMPTRAEVTDTAHAVATGADATMLSGETASGQRPMLVVKAMSRIHRAMEQHMARLETLYDIRFNSDDEAEMDSAVTLAQEQEADAIIVISETGRTAKHLSKFRPHIPVIALVPDAAIARELALYFGVYPLTMAYDKDDDVTVREGMKLAAAHQLVAAEQKVILLRDRAKDPLIDTV